MTASDSPLPPGRSGLPFLGETRSLLEDGFGFVEARTRRYGPVFRTKILGRRTAVICGPDANGRFIDETQVQRQGGMLPHVQALFGGPSLPALDGDAHRERKAFVMAAFTREALESYLPHIQRQVRAALEGWSMEPELRWLDGLRCLAIETISTTILGLSAGPTLEAVAADYEILQPGFSSLPVAFPGTKFSRAKQALDRILGVYETNIREHQASPRDDGLSRILAAKSIADGRAIRVDEAKLELHHIVIAGIIVWAWFASAALQLDKHPAVRERLRREVSALPETLTMEALAAAPFLRRVSMEIRRMSPVVPVFFGKARTTFEFAGHRIPKGWMVLWGIRSSHLWPQLYENPDTFDPDRFSAERHEDHNHPHGFAPNGAGDAMTGHKCAGYEFAPMFLQTFLVELLRGYRWAFTPGQDLSFDWSAIPAAPRGGLQAKITRA
jgi:retinoid hydroxylase